MTLRRIIFMAFALMGLCLSLRPALYQWHADHHQHQLLFAAQLVFPGEDLSDQHLRAYYQFKPIDNTLMLQLASRYRANLRDPFYLRQACGLHHLIDVQYLVSKGSNPNIEHHRGMLLIQHAYERNQIDLFRVLATQKIQPRTLDYLLYQSLTDQRLDYSELIVPQVKQRSVRYLLSAFADAIRHRRMDVITFMLKHDIVHHSYHSRRHPLLIFASADTGWKTEEILEMILNKGGDINTVFPGQTALGRALQNRNLPLARLLLNHGAVANPPRDPMLLVDRAIRTNDAVYLDLLLNYDAQILRVPWFQMRSDTSVDILKVLNRHQVNLHATDRDGMTLLHHVVDRRNINLMYWLLQRGHSPHVKDLDGLTPLDYAPNHVEIQKVLKQYMNKYPEPVSNES